jgi:hypothetical protein
VPDDDLIIWSKDVALLRLYKHVRYIPTPIVFIENIPVSLVVLTVVLQAMKKYPSSLCSCGLFYLADIYYEGLGSHGLLINRCLMNMKVQFIVKWVIDYFRMCY